MKDRPQSSVYVPPHQRLRSTIVVPSGSPSGYPFPARSSENHGLTSNPNPNFDDRITPVHYSISKHYQEQNNQGGGHFQFNQQRTGSPCNPKQQRKGNGNGIRNSFYYNQQKSNSFRNDWQQGDSQRSPVVDDFSEEGSDREFGEFEPISYPAGGAY